MNTYENRPWLANYPQGMPANIDPDQYPNLVAFFDKMLVKFAKKQAFECMGKVITYGEMDKMATNFGAYLQSRGLEPGDRFAIMMPNCLQYPVAIIGALRAGLVLVNTNPLYTEREMLHQFTDSDVKGILIVENFASHLEKILPQTGIKVPIVTNLGELLGIFKGTMVNLVVRHVKKMVPKYSIPNSVSFNTALSGGKSFKLRPLQSNPNDVIVHQYTGGTTGVSKGAMLTNRNLVANLFQMEACMKVVMKEGEEIALSPLPMYHIFAFTVNCLAMISLGAKTVLVTNARDIKSLIKEFNNNKISVFTGLNTLYNAIMNHPDFKSADVSALKLPVAGGMALQKAVAERWAQITKTKIVEGYGLTETSPVAIANPMDGRARVGYIGLPVPSTEIRIVGESGEIMPIGERGEIQIKGPQVMKGYYNKLDETKNVMTDDGWFCSGDIGIMEPDGFFKIVDRMKDMILVSGFNVYPNEVEDELVKHPKILEAAAIGIPSEKSGEVVKVFVVKKDKSLTSDEVVEYCRTVMTGYKVPKEVEFREDLPKSNVGKILRRELRDKK